MAHFYGEIGSRSSRNHRISKATRTGTKSNGMSAHVRGWSVGARIELSHDEKRNVDVVRVYRTSGSHASASDVLLAEYEENASFKL